MTNNATFEEQITKLWAYYNLHSDMPDAHELAEMVGQTDEKNPCVDKNNGPADSVRHRLLSQRTNSCSEVC